VRFAHSELRIATVGPFRGKWQASASRGRNQSRPQRTDLTLTATSPPGAILAGFFCCPVLLTRLPAVVAARPLSAFLGTILALWGLGSAPLRVLDHGLEGNTLKAAVLPLLPERNRSRYGQRKPRFPNPGASLFSRAGRDQAQIKAKLASAHLNYFPCDNFTCAR